MSVLGSLTMEDLTRIRKMSRPDAELFLTRHTLSDAERTSALALAGKDTDPAPFFKVRRQWMTVAWLLGASFKQIGTLHNIARQTVMDMVERTIDTATRRSERIAHECSNERLSHYRQKFNANAERLTDMHPVEAAEWLNENSEYEEDIV